MLAFSREKRLREGRAECLTKLGSLYWLLLLWVLYTCSCSHSSFPALCLKAGLVVSWLSASASFLRLISLAAMCQCKTANPMDSAFLCLLLPVSRLPQRQQVTWSVDRSCFLRSLVEEECSLVMHG